MQKRVGFAGLGLMGIRMAENLLKKGFPLTVWNRSAGKGGGPGEGRCARGQDAVELAEQTDVVVACVADPRRSKTWSSASKA